MNTRRGKSGSMSPNKLKRSLSVSKGGGTRQTGLLQGAEVLRSLANNTTAAPSVLEPGTLRLFITHGENLETLQRETGPGVWRLSVSVDVLGLQQQLDQAPTPPISRPKDPSSSMQLTKAVAAPRVDWNRSLSVPVHWSPTQSRVPVLHCQLSHSSDSSVPIAFATLDLAALLLRPLQLVYACLPLLASTDVEPERLSSSCSGPCLFVRCLYASASSAPPRVTAMAERLASPLPPPGPMPVGAPAGRLQVQLYSVTKLRRGCSGVANPQVWLCLSVPGQACPPLVRLDGSLSPFGEYAIYFDEAAEAALAVGTGCGAHPLLHVVLTGQGAGGEEGESQAQEVGRVSIPLLDAACKEGHVIDACYPLRAPGSCLKVADLRCSLQFVPSSLGYAQQSSGQAEEQQGGNARVLQVRVGALRGLYSYDFPGRKDPFVELGLILASASGAGPGEGEEEGSMPEGSHTGAEEEEEEECGFVCSHVRSSVCTAGFEHLVWDEVLELPLPPNTSHAGATVVVKLKSAASLAPDRLLGCTHVPWPLDAGSERGWFTLSHPRAPDESVGEVSLAFLGLAPQDRGEGGQGAGGGAWMMDQGHNRDLTSLFSSLPLSPTRGVPSGGITTALVMSPTRGGVREAWTAWHSMGPSQPHSPSPLRTVTQTPHRPPPLPSSPTRVCVPRVLAATRCSQLHPCGPGLLLVTVSCLHCVTRHGGCASIEAFRASTLLVKVRPRQVEEEEEEQNSDTLRELQLEEGEGGAGSSSDGLLEGFGFGMRATGERGGHDYRTLPLPQLQGRLYPEVPAWPSLLGGSAAVGLQEMTPQPPRATSTVFVAPLAYGEESQVRLYVGRGRDGRHRRWYRATLDPRPALSLPGREVQAWKLLTPVSVGPSPADTCEEKGHHQEAAQRMGRAHVQLRYLPHTVGTAVVGLQRASLSLGPEAALSADPSVSFVVNSLFVRLRVVPGGEWAMSTARDVILPASRGRGEQSLSWGDEQVCVGVDTSTLPLLKPLSNQQGPCLELALLNDRPVVENVLGVATFPLAHLLTLPPPDASDASEPFTLLLRHPLTDAVVGEIKTTLAFRHLYTPAAALDSPTHPPSSETRQNSATLTHSQGGQDEQGRSVARAIRDLKRLFYSLDRSGDGLVSQEELLAYLSKPVATHHHPADGAEGPRQQQDLTDLMKVVLQGRGRGDLDVGEAVREVFRSVDVNGDGSISWAEWASFLDMLLLSPHASCLLDVGLLRRNAEAMRTAALPLSLAPAAAAAPQREEVEAPPPLPIAVRRPHVGTPLPAAEAAPALPVLTHTTALLRLDDLSLQAGPASPNPRPKKLNSHRGSVASPGRGPGRQEGKASGVRSREALEEENTRLRLKLQAVEVEARRKDAENRRGLEVEKAKFRKELGYLTCAASDVLGVKNGNGREALALTPVGFAFARDAGVEATPAQVPVPAAGGQASGGGEELLHLRALVTALRGSNDELRSALGSAKGEVANCLMQLDLAKSELSEASRHGLHEEVVKLELRRLDAARRHAEGARLLELRGVMSELSVAKQELRSYAVEVDMQQEAAQRSRQEVEQLRQALEREQKQCAHFQAEAQRCRAALLVYEHDHMRNRALIRLREASLSDAASRHRMRSDASLAELRAQHVAALRIQSGMRGHRARSQVARQRGALLTIQSCARAILASRRVRNLRSMREASATRIQSRFRGHMVKQEVWKQKQSAAVIQAGVRGARERRQHGEWMMQARRERNDKSVVIQSAFRAARQKRIYNGLKRAVQVIQAKLKKFHLRKQRVYRRTAARRIIRALASWLGRRHQSASVLQRAFKQRAVTSKQEQAKAEKRRVQLAPAPISASEASASRAAPTSALATTAGAGFGRVDDPSSLTLAASVPIKTLVGTAGLGMTEQVEDESDEALFTVPGLEEELEAERTARRASQTLTSGTVMLRSGAQTAAAAGAQAGAVTGEDDESLFAIDSAPASPRHADTQRKAAPSFDSEITISEVVNAVLDEEDRIFSIDSLGDSPREASTTAKGALTLTGRQATPALQEEASRVLKSTVSSGVAGTSKAVGTAAEDVAAAADDDSLFAIEGLDDTVRSHDTGRQLTLQSTAKARQVNGATVPSGLADKLEGRSSAKLPNDSADTPPEKQGVTHGEPKPLASPLPPALSSDTPSAVEGGVPHGQQQSSIDHASTVKDVKEETVTVEPPAAAATLKGAPVDSVGAVSLSTPADTPRRTTGALAESSVGGVAAAGGNVRQPTESPRTTQSSEGATTVRDLKRTPPESMAPGVVASTGDAGSPALSTAGPLQSQQQADDTGAGPSTSVSAMAVRDGEAGLPAAGAKPESATSEGAAALLTKAGESTKSELVAPTGAGSAESPRRGSPPTDSTVKAENLTVPTDLGVEGKGAASSPATAGPQAGGAVLLHAEKVDSIPALTLESATQASTSTSANSAPASAAASMKAAGEGSTTAGAINTPPASNLPAETLKVNDLDVKAPVEKGATVQAVLVNTEASLQRESGPVISTEVHVDSEASPDKPGANSSSLPAKKTDMMVAPAEPPALASAGLADGAKAVQVADGGPRKQSPRGTGAVDSASSPTIQGPLLGSLMGRSVRVRLPAEEEGGEDEWLPAQVVAIDSGSNTVRVRYYDDPDTLEDLKVDSPDLQLEPVVAQPLPSIAAPPAPKAAAASPTTAPVKVEAAKPMDEAATVLVAKAPAPATVVPPTGEACIGWSVRVDLGDGITELGKVTSINRANGNLLVLFPELGDEPEECGIDEVEFLGKEV